MDSITPNGHNLLNKGECLDMNMASKPNYSIRSIYDGDRHAFKCCIVELCFIRFHYLNVFYQSP